MSKEPKPPLGPILTLKEAAERLRTTRHAVAKVAREHGLCAEFGRDLRFSEADIAAIYEAMRLPRKSRVIREHVPASTSEANLTARVEALLNRGKRTKSQA